jgi:putative redox protein
MCKVGTVRFIARKNNWEVGNVTAELVQEVARGEGGLKTTIQIKMNIEGNLTEEQKDELIKQADRCYIHRLLNGEWDILPIML